MADVHTLPPPPYPSLARRRQDVEYVVLADANDTAETSLQEYLRLIWRRKWLLLLPLVCIMPLIGLYVAMQTPRYTATATVLIEDKNPKILAIAEVATLEKSPDFYSTQYEIIKSRAVAEEVVDKLQLDTVQPAATATPGKASWQALTALPGRLWHAVITSVQGRDRALPASSASAVAAADLQRQRAAGRLLATLEVEPRKGTKLVDIILQGDDPNQVPQHVNAVAAAYARQNLEKRLEASRKATVWLDKEADTLRSKIVEGEGRLQTVKEDKRLVVSDASSAQTSDVQNLGALHLSSLEKSRERMALRAELDELRKALTSADPLQSVKYPALLNNPSVSGLRTRYTDLQIQATELAKKFGDKHPKMVALAEQIAEVRKAMTGEVRRVIASLENQYATLVTQENELKQLFNTQKSSVIRSDKDRTEYETLRRDLDIHKAMYQEISKRLAETTITTALETNNVTVVEEALAGSLVPSGAIKYLLLGFLVSLGCGGGLALMAEGLDKRFKNVAEVEQTLALPFLGFIPHHVLPRRRPPALITLQKPWSAAAEAYHTVRTWIQLTTPPVRSVLVTSASPREGKSTTAANLAISFAQLGRRVLLVDADLRHPSLHRIFGGLNSQGLTDVLVHGVEWQEVVHTAPMDNLKILFAGPRPSNPTELLSMARMKRLIESWKDCCDLVIFDGPVVLSIPDVMILVPTIESVLMVHSQGRSTREMVVEAKRQLERASARLLGIVLNNVRPKEEYYYSYHYGGKYGGAVTPGRPAQRSAGRDAAIPTIEMHPTAVSQQWMGPVEAPPPVADPEPVVVGREGHSDDIQLTLHTVTLRHQIGPQQAAAGGVFLIADVEITNDGAFGHLFDPTLTALMARAEADYGRALASFIPIYGAEDDAAMSPTERVLGHYDAELTAHVGGWASAVDIAAEHTSRGSLVYYIPEASVLYTLVYTNPPITLNIPFSLPPSS